MTDPHNLVALSPLDGRYVAHTRQLAEYFSEFALIRYRVQAEIAYLTAFLQTTQCVSLSSQQTLQLQQIAEIFSLVDAKLVKEHEATCHHDFKAVEYFLRDRCIELDLSACIPYIHIGLTSEDTNSIAYGLALKESRDEVVLPVLWNTVDSLVTFVTKNAEVPMLARTHGQPAVPTTLGKEYAVFLSRLLPEMQVLAGRQFSAKVSGAVGTYAAQQLAFPDVDWPEFSNTLFAKLGLVADPLSTQIVSAENYVRYFQTLLRINNILLDCARDSWQYISDGWLMQLSKKSDVGSSTMPQKINPIDFENAEGNFGLANALLSHFSEKLPISRLQRDLSDSTVKRSFGVALGHCVLGYQSLTRGLGKVSADTATIQQALTAHPEIIAEGLQTLLRADDVPDAYEIYKGATRGNRGLSLSDLQTIAVKHAKSEVTKQKIANLSLLSYIGLAVEQTQHILDKVANTKKKGMHANKGK